MAKRYTDKEKQKVVDFVVEHNKNNNGRGGQAAAKKKFGINPITIASWLEKLGPGTAGKKRTTKASGGKNASKAKGGSVGAVLQRMADIQNEIDSLQSEFDALKKQI